MVRLWNQKLRMERHQIKPESLQEKSTRSEQKYTLQINTCLIHKVEIRDMHIHMYLENKQL
jgi:hypothetical protein